MKNYSPLAPPVLLIKKKIAPNKLREYISR